MLFIAEDTARAQVIMGELAQFRVALQIAPPIYNKGTFQHACVREGEDVLTQRLEEQGTQKLSPEGQVEAAVDGRKLGSAESGIISIREDLHKNPRTVEGGLEEHRGERSMPERGRVGEAGLENVAERGADAGV